MSQTTQPQTKKQPNLNTSKIDLRALPIQDLYALRDEISVLLSSPSRPLKKDDMAIVYTLALVNADGVVDEQSGVVNMPSVLNPRLLPLAPATLEQAFTNQIFTPLNAAAYDVFEQANNTENEIRTKTPKLNSGFSLPGT